MDGLGVISRGKEIRNRAAWGQGKRGVQDSLESDLVSPHGRNGLQRQSLVLESVSAEVKLLKLDGTGSRFEDLLDRLCHFNADAVARDQRNRGYAAIHRAWLRRLQRRERR